MKSVVNREYKHTPTNTSSEPLKNLMENKNSFIKMRTNCSLDLLNIRTIQRDMLIKATDQMVLENQKVNAILDQIIETVLESDTDHPDVKKIKEIITDER